VEGCISRLIRRREGWSTRSCKGFGEWVYDIAMCDEKYDNERCKSR
jgi:hypothetical protein